MLQCYISEQNNKRQFRKLRRGILFTDWAVVCTIAGIGAMTWFLLGIDAGLAKELSELKEEIKKNTSAG